VYSERTRPRLAQAKRLAPPHSLGRVRVSFISLVVARRLQSDDFCPQSVIIRRHPSSTNGIIQVQDGQARKYAVSNESPSVSPMRSFAFALLSPSLKSPLRSVLVYQHVFGEMAPKLCITHRTIGTRTCLYWLPSSHLPALRHHQGPPP
jgi:hypothetical protein